MRLLREARKQQNAAIGTLYYAHVNICVWYVLLKILSSWWSCVLQKLRSTKRILVHLPKQIKTCRGWKWHYRWYNENTPKIQCWVNTKINACLTGKIIQAKAKGKPVAKPKWQWCTARQDIMSQLKASVAELKNILMSWKHLSAQTEFPQYTTEPKGKSR